MEMNVGPWLFTPWSKHRGGGVSKIQGVEGPQLFWFLAVLRLGGHSFARGSFGIELTCPW
jgi:hypothetical protein